MKRALSTGVTIAFDDAGTGVAALFLHGFPHNRSLWSGQLSALASDARCVAPDLRGFGESDLRPPYSIDQYADDAAALITSLELVSVVVVGLSMGGYVALALWRRYPHLVRALVLADTKAGGDTEEGKQKRNEMIKLVRERGVAALADVQIEGMLGKSTREKSPELVQGVRAMLAAAPADGVEGALAAMRDRPDSLPLLPTITVPTLIVVGDEDVLTPPKEARKMHEAIDGSILELIPGAGHLSNVERPSVFNHRVSAFLASLGRS